MGWGMIYEFDEFRVDEDRFVLERVSGEPVELTPKALELLLLLVRSPGNLQTKDTIAREVWGGLHVSDTALPFQVKQIRMALDDLQKPHRFVETVHGKGLRFVTEVTAKTAPATHAQPTEISGQGKTVEERARSQSPPRLAVVAAILGAIAVAVISFASGFPGYETIDESRSFRAAVAVLPFREVGMQSGQSYIGEGLADELTSVLARIDGLKVPSSSSAFRFVGNTGLSMSETADTLGVSHIVEGSVAREGNSLKVTVHLIDAIDDVRIWTETYSRSYDAANIVRIQEQIVSAIVVEMLGELAPEPERLAVKTESIKALEFYLQAQALMRDETAESVNQAIELLKQAIDADPEYVDAYSLLFFAYNGAYFHGGVAWDELAQMQDLALERAVELDPDDPRVLRAVGFTELVTGQSREAIATLQQSLIGEPNNKQAFSIIARAYGQLGRAIEEREFLSRAQQIDPLNPRILYSLAMAEFNLGDTQTALEVARTNMRWNADDPAAQLSLARLLVQVGDYAAAHDLLQSLLRRNPGNYQYTRWIAYLYLQVGSETQVDQAVASMAIVKAELDAILKRREEVDRFLADNPEVDTSDDFQGVMYFNLRDFETALPFLKRATRELEITGPADLGWNEMLWYLAHAHVLRDAGDPEGDAILEKFEEALSGQSPQSADNYSVFMTSAGVEMLKGNEEKAIDWLEAALEDGHTFVDLKYHPTFDDLQDNPRYMRIRTKMEAKAAEYRAEFERQISSESRAELTLEAAA